MCDQKCSWSGLNGRPPDYESDALTPELQEQKELESSLVVGAACAPRWPGWICTTASQDTLPGILLVIRPANVAAWALQ